MRQLRALIGLSCVVSLVSCGDQPRSSGRPVIAVFTAEPPAVGPGETTRLTWSVAGSATLVITAGDGRVLLESAELSGSLVTPPLAETTDFTLTAAATSEDHASSSQTITVEIVPLSIESFVAEPAVIGRGQTSVLSWRVAGNVTALSIADQSGAVIHQGATNTGMISVMPEAPATYRLLVQSGARRVEATLSISIGPTLPRIARFAAGPVIRGQPCSLAWQTEEATEIQISHDGTVRRPWTTAAAAMGTVQLVVSERSSVFRLEARNAAGQVEQSIIVMPEDIPVIDSFSVTPDRFSSSALVVAAWSTSFASEVIVSLNGEPVAVAPEMTDGSVAFEVRGEAASVKLVAKNPAAETERTLVIAASYDDLEPNDTPAQAIPLSGERLPVRGTLGGGDRSDLYAVTVPEGARIYARAGVTSSGVCAMDTVLRVLDGDGLTELVTVDDTLDPAISPCSELNPMVEAQIDHMAAGTYYVAVDAKNSTGGSYDLVVSVTGPGPVASYSMTPIGSPLWEIDDCQVFAAQIGLLSTGFDEAAWLIDSIFQPLHLYDLQGELPGPAHTRNYRQELSASAAARGYVNSNVHVEADFIYDRGVMIICMLVPGVNAPFGPSIDSMNGPIIPWSVFPIERLDAIDKDSVYWFGGKGTVIVSYQERNPPIPGDGASHYPTYTFVSESFRPSNDPVPGLYEYEMTYTDATGHGWVVTVPITVQ